MLCYDCEQRLSVWEGKVKQLFYPEGRQARLPLRYGSWLQLFATSISWRALTFLKYSKPNPYVAPPPAAQRLLPTLPEEAHTSAEERRLAWAAILNAERAPPHQNDQHVIFLNGKNFPGEHSNVVGFTACSTPGLTAVFAQLGPICVLGTISDDHPLRWKGTRVQSLGGVFPAGKQSIPESFGRWLQDYFQNVRDVEA